LQLPHHFTVDVEEYFHATALEPWFPRDQWDDHPRRSPRVMERLLALLEERSVRGTFYVVGWLAEREPEMVRAIARGGHEVGSHGWHHRLVTSQTREEFREEVRRSRALLEELTGSRVSGFRAPSFSIVPGLEWALDILLEEGYRYDTSLFPVRTHPTYGYPCPRDAHRMERPGGTLVEVPPCTLRVFGVNLPASGGAYFRFLPYGVLRAAFRSSERRGASGTFYIHPWELDPDPPVGAVPFLQRLRSRGTTGDPWTRVRRLLNDFTFRRVDETVDALLGASGGGGGVG